MRGFWTRTQAGPSDSKPSSLFFTLILQNMKGCYMKRCPVVKYVQGKLVTLVQNFSETSAYRWHPSHCGALRCSFGHRSLWEALREPVVLRTHRGDRFPVLCLPALAIVPTQMLLLFGNFSSFRGWNRAWEAICERSTLFLEDQTGPRSTWSWTLGLWLLWPLGRSWHKVSLSNPRQEGGHLQLRSQPKLRTGLCWECHFQGGSLPHWDCYNSHSIKYWLGIHRPQRM